MRYNTGNPVGPDGSNSPFDLYDNSGIIDLLLTGTLGEYLDRLGVPLKSWRGIMQQVTDYLIAQGYESVYLTYGAGVVVERQTQLVQRDGELFRVKNADDIPLELTGDWSEDSQKLLSVGDAALRQILASANGADHVGLGGGTVTTAFGKVIRPEQFPVAGPVGVGNAAADTAAWQAAANALQSGGKFKAEGDYLINGRVTFPFRTDCDINLKGARLYQQFKFAATLYFSEHLGTSLRKGKFYGRGGADGEYNGESSSYNGVAAVYFDGGDEIEVDGLYGRDHAGGCITMMGVRSKTVKNCNIRGIGAPYIDPVGQGNQGNGSDFGIMCQPKNNALGWIYEDRFENNRVWNHAFGIQSVMTKVCIVRGNDIGPCPGQHGIYGIENDGMSVIGNTFRGCFQIAVKTQFENYSGRFIGPAWQSFTPYAVGDTVRAFSTLFVCVQAHTSGATFAQGTQWAVDPRTFRRGLVVHDNTFDGNGYDIGVISSAASDGRQIYHIAPSFRDNVSTNCVNSPFSLDRCTEADVRDNSMDGGDYGIFARDFSGTMSGNKIRSPRKNAIAFSTYGNTRLADNDMLNPGLAGTTDDTKAAVLVTAPTAASPADRLANPTIYYERNGLRFPTGDALGPYLVFDSDTRNVWRLFDNYGTTTTKLMRIDGTVEQQFRNYFAPSGYYNSAQNEPTYSPTGFSTLRSFNAATATTVQIGSALGTLLSDLQGKRVVR